MQLCVDHIGGSECHLLYFELQMFPFHSIFKWSMNLTHLKLDTQKTQKLMALENENFSFFMILMKTEVPKKILIILCLRHTLFSLIFSNVVF